MGRFRDFENRFDAWFDSWYDNLSPDMQIWVALSPLIVPGVVLFLIALIWG